MNYNYSLNTDEDQVLLEMFEFFDDLGLPDHIDQKAYETFQNKFFGQDVNHLNSRVDSDLWIVVTDAGTSMKGTVKRWSIPKTGNIVYRTTNLRCITIGIPRWRRIMIGEMQYRMRIAYVKSVLTF